MCSQADMVLSSIGYRSKPMEGVAFDAARGVVIHRYMLPCLESSDLTRAAQLFDILKWPLIMRDMRVQHAELLLCLAPTFQLSKMVPKRCAGLAGQAGCCKQMAAPTLGCMWWAGQSEVPLASLVRADILNSGFTQQLL